MSKSASGDPRSGICEKNDFLCPGGEQPLSEAEDTPFFQKLETVSGGYSYGVKKYVEPLMKFAYDRRRIDPAQEPPPLKKFVEPVAQPSLLTKVVNGVSKTATGAAAVVSDLATGAANIIATPFASDGSSSSGKSDNEEPRSLKTLDTKEAERKIKENFGRLNKEFK